MKFRGHSGSVVFWDWLGSVLLPSGSGIQGEMAPEQSNKNFCFQRNVNMIPLIVNVEKIVAKNFESS